MDHAAEARGMDHLKSTSTLLDYAVTLFTMRLTLFDRSDKLRIEREIGNKLIHLPRHLGQCIGRSDVP